MNEVKFHLTKNGKTKTLELALPSNWSECTKLQILALSGFNVIGEQRTVEMEQTALRALLGSKSHYLNMLTPEQQLGMLALIDWVYETPIHAPVLPYIYLGSLWRNSYFLLPAAKLENIVCYEWYLADDFYTDFMQNRKPEDLDKLVATLCRPADRNHQSAIQRNDKRQPLVSIGEVETRAKYFEKLSEAQKLYVLAFFSGCKSYIHQVYRGYIFPHIDEDGEAESTGDVLPFGWYSLFQSVAESGVFGNLYDVLYRTKFHDLCAYLVEKKVQHDQWKAKQKQPSAA